MDKGYEQKYFVIEEKNWWFQARRKTILSLVKKYPKDINILDIGCSGGLLMRALKANGYTNVTGLDISPEAIEQCKKSGLNDVFIMDAHCPDFKDETFDLIIASDNLEHLKDDELALNNWNKLLKKNGNAIIFVPAFMSLWSEHDVVNLHFRRYKKQELVNKSQKAGFDVVKSSYWNSLLFFPAYIYRKFRNMVSDPNVNPKDHFEDYNSLINGTLRSWIGFEDIFFNSTGLPIGLSVMVVLKKK